MHELSIATALYDGCRRAIEERGGGRLEDVCVDIGELSSVEPDLLEFAWQAVLAGTPDDGARLEIRWCRARQRCARCGDVGERQPGTWLRLCPRCETPLVVEGGRELDIRRLAYCAPEEVPT